MSNHQLVLFHAPQSRSLSVLTLLKELAIDYKLEVLNIIQEENLRPEYLSINPLGKVPAIKHKETIITEQVAIFIYLADRYSLGDLAPAIDDPDRGTYLRWLTMYAACFEPAVCDKGLKRQPGPRKMSPYGEYDTIIKMLLAQLEKGPYMLGERFSSADLLWGIALWVCTTFGLVESHPLITQYIERIIQRPSFIEASKLDAELVAVQKAAMEEVVNS